MTAQAIVIALALAVAGAAVGALLQRRAGRSPRLSRMVLGALSPLVIVVLAKASDHAILHIAVYMAGWVAGYFLTPPWGTEKPAGQDPIVPEHQPER